MLIRAFFLLSIILSSSVSAAEYDVQIGAFRNPIPASVDLPAKLGEHRVVAGTDGLTRLLVGPFANRIEAERVRGELRAAGYPGAFIRAAQIAGSVPVPGASTPGMALTTAGPNHGGQHHEGNSLSAGEMEKLSSLSDQERRDVVYLDGQLHKKVGDKFLPLND